MQALYGLIIENMLWFILVVFALLFGAAELGKYLGGKTRDRNEGNRDEGANLVVGSILGLLAFVLALNLSNATGRLGARQDAALHEANTISTAWLRAGIAEGDTGAGLQATVADYLKLRYDYVAAPPRAANLAEMVSRSNTMQNEMWNEITQIVQADPSPASTALMTGFNEMFDASSNVYYQMEKKMPAQVVQLMILMSIVGMAGAGYLLGNMGRKGHVPLIVLALVWSTVVSEVLNIGSGRIWSIHTDTAPYLTTMESIGMTLPE